MPAEKLALPKPYHLARRMVSCVLVCVILIGPGCVSRAEFPKNLYYVKQELRAYAKGPYLSDVDKVAKQVEQWIVERTKAAKPGERLMVVFDLDETILSNDQYFESVDYGYSSATWYEWNLKGVAPALPPIKEVCDVARKNGVFVAFITGRREKTKSGAEKNLKAIGCADYAALRCRPDNEHGSVVPFKTRERKLLETDGYTIIANVGDQQSDLDGGFSEKTFLVPNPFYFVP